MIYIVRQSVGLRLVLQTAMAGVDRTPVAGLVKKLVQLTVMELVVIQQISQLLIPLGINRKTRFMKLL